MKGETSGHRQWVREVRLDCDGDTLLVTVDQEGAGLPHRRPHLLRRPAAAGRGRRGRAVERGRPATAVIDPDAWRSSGRRPEPSGDPGATDGCCVDAETAIGLYRKLARNRPGSYLLESAEQGVWSRYSFIGVQRRRDADRARRRGGLDRATPRPACRPVGTRCRPSRETLRRLHTPRDERLPPFTSGLVGYLELRRRAPGRAAARQQPRRPATSPSWPSCWPSDLAVLDHHDSEVWLVANAINFDDSDERVDEAYADAVARVEAMTAAAGRADPVRGGRRPELDHELPGPPPAHAGEFQAAVAAAVEEIKAGEAFQIVVSQRFEVDTTADALDIYRVLRLTNPSPYMYLLRLEIRGFDIVGLLARGAGHGARTTSRSPTRSPAPSRAARLRPRTPPWRPSCWPTRRSGPST